MEEKYIITLSGSSIEPVEGTEELTTKEECETWLLENQEFTANEEALKMASTFGLDSTANYTLGILELAAVFLFAIPRTGIIGTLLLAAYMGGAIATHLEHGLPVIAPCAIQAFIWIAAFVRFPELSRRILGKGL